MSARRNIFPAGCLHAIPLVVAGWMVLPASSVCGQTTKPSVASDTAITTTAPSHDLELRLRQRRQELLKKSQAHAERASAALDPAETEWLDVAAAMQKHTPNWWRRFERSPLDSPQRARMMRAATERQRELKRIEKRDPQQYDREIEQIEVEDEVLGLARKIWRDESGPEVEQLKAQLRDRVARLVDLRIANREARLARLMDTLNAERIRLEADKSDRAEVVDRQFDAILNHRLEPGFAGPEGPPGRGPQGAPPALGAPFGDDDDADGRPGSDRRPPRGGPRDFPAPTRP